MTEQADLQAKIAELAGRINLHKQQKQQQQYFGNGRWYPYARSGRGTYTPTHKNRTLVLNGTVTPPGNVLTSGGGTHQIMNKDTYDRELRHKLEYIEQQHNAKRRKRNVEEQHRILHHFAAPQQASRELVINGIRFTLTHDGSKLTRMPDAATAGLETPKKTKVADVEFYRTKHGNLVRASALNTSARNHIKQAPQCEHFTRHGTDPPFPEVVGFAQAQTLRSHHLKPLAGSCPYGARCHFNHDPVKVAICKDFAKKGQCHRGANCDLSHEMTYHRVPACIYFLRGNCTNAACRYPHVQVSSAAPVCRAFATLGYCAKGTDCDKRHVVECPDYANRGFCANLENGRCTLPHPERAAVLRKAVERQAKIDSDLGSDLSSDEEDVTNLEDVDSDQEDILMTGMGDDKHELSQQHDYVAFY